MKKTFFLLLAISWQVVAQEAKFSNPMAPVTNIELTVPKEVKPIFDYWLRDTYIMLGPDGMYYLTGTTATPNRIFPNGNIHCWDYNDGLYMWKSKDLKNWTPMGLIWSFEKDAADWQKQGKPIKEGAKSLNNDPLEGQYRALWAPELHYIKSQKKWMIVTCINGGAGSFILESISGKPEGPYKNIVGNTTKPIYGNIDASLFEDDNGEVYVVAHNHFIAKMNKDLSDLEEPYQKIKETPYNPEPYIEGIFMTKHHGKYILMQTVWSVRTGENEFTYLPVDKKTGNALHSYDVVISEADSPYGPFSERYPAILQGGHNNLFVDKKGDWWSTTFFNPRGEMGKEFKITCRPGLVPVKWVNKKLQPDHARAKKFYGHK
ncbi:family 43 glycosylhydrolase [Cellulophaga sp. BC115SP]|uniref:family 43 glycosylhydrolase n=1 Tax=Cellulophaga sp. BC115SP TaxID=2683263 RepID=UPI00141336D6|nr:family 43 glycosylhydrolase [Cellulophaga sp. BC115SP]NBB29887.1 family 43 glycosylhydrolase [Cellulophaga sp. BC115SP]